MMEYGMLNSILPQSSATGFQSHLFSRRQPLNQIGQRHGADFE